MIGRVEAGKAHLLDGLHFIAAGGAKKVVFKAVLTASATFVPVIALVDHNEIGKTAARRLEDLGWKKKDRILSLSAWSDRFKRNYDVEIKDLLPQATTLAVQSSGCADLDDLAATSTPTGPRHA